MLKVVIISLLLFVSLAVFLYFLSWLLIFKKTEKIKKSDSSEIKERFQNLYDKVKLKSQKNAVLYEMAQFLILSGDTSKGEDLMKFINKGIFIEK